MFKYLMNALAIGVSSLDPVRNDGDEKQKAIWIIALVAVVVVCVVLSQIKFGFGEKMRAKKAEKAKQKSDKKRDEELDRLHEIKRKNKRK